MAVRSSLGGHGPAERRSNLASLLHQSKLLAALPSRFSVQSVLTP